MKNTSHQQTVGTVLSLVGRLMPGVGCLSTMLGALWLWRHRCSSRRALADLNDSLLRDVGLTRSDRDGEVEKAFWRR